MMRSALQATQRATKCTMHFLRIVSDLILHCLFGTDYDIGTWKVGIIVEKESSENSAKYKVMKIC